MWRLSSLVARGLNRFHAPNVQGYVHGEAEALNPSSLLPLGQNAGGKSYSHCSSRQKNGQNEKEEKKKRTFQSFHCQVPQYSMLDAFGWGAAAVFFLQLARHVSIHNSVANSAKEDKSLQPSYLEKILHSLAQTQHDSVRLGILPKAAQTGVWRNIGLQGKPLFYDQDASLESSTSSGSGLGQLSNEEDDLTLGNTNSSCNTDSSANESDSDLKDTSSSTGHKVLQDEDLGESLPLAASKLLDAVENSIPMVLNISGIISVRERADFNSAFQFFRQSADCGYHKAQYNAGVCYEQGKGVAKDMRKAAACYLLAAKNGHNQAKYRYARYILQQAKAEKEDIQCAVQMLEEAASAGLKEAQAYLGVLYTKEPYMNLQKAVRFFWVAAENGDSQSQYYLGLCYENGHGVPGSRKEALRHYEKAAKTGHGPALHRVHEMKREQDQNSPSVSLRTAASSPCLPVLERVSILTRARNSHTANRSNNLGLPHSMSTGNLLAMSQATSSSYSLTPVHLNTGNLQELL
ncbi:hypothetical protein GDO86_005243 [Hymenochirus boettgeri]|uniref:Death ligand signal enhancer n=1 Tax=Hymenochirus boettgeri TaxID=247094 RepID=A0A8T2J8M1_9PIPI|nr:hypothetical protein GDO86_005243 [Hymenochirus boettgeri]